MHVKNLINKAGSKIINLQSEILFREAEDLFLYFNKPKQALNKLDEAIELTPSHHKSLCLKGDILYLKGKIDKALGMYLAAYNYTTSAKILASISLCLETKEDYSTALHFCDTAFTYVNEDNYPIYLSLYELKVSILLKSKKYKQAKNLIENAKNLLSISELVSLKNQKNIINAKLKMRNKLKTLKFEIVQ